MQKYLHTNCIQLEAKNLAIQITPYAFNLLLN